MRVKYLLTGGNENGIHYDRDGNPTGPAPITGTELGLAGGVAAGKAAIGTYKVMKALTKGHKSAIQAHHIVEVTSTSFG